MPRGPSLLGDAVQSIATREQADVLDEAAKIGPLWRAHGTVDRNKHADRRIIEEIVAAELPIAAGLVFSRNAKRRVKLLPNAGTSRIIRLLLARGGDLII